MIPVCRPYLDGTEKAYVLDALDTGWISSAGKYLKEFETQFASLAGCTHAVACSNGTAAVHLALIAAGVGPRDRVVVPAFTMMASVFPVLQQGAVPVFVDCDPETWTLAPEELARIEGPIKAVMPVHIYGHPCDMDPIREWARARQVVVIEDAAEGHGATYKGHPVGSLSDVATFSFYANKIITCGEGGMITTNNPEIAQSCRYHLNLCFDKDPDRRFIHEAVGYNYRLTNLQAAIGLAQVESAQRLIEMRRRMAEKYLERLKGLTEYIQLPVEKPWARNVYWMFGVVLRKNIGMNVSDVRARLLKDGVDTRRFFYPGHLQPVLSQYRAGVRAPVSEDLWNLGFYLPSSSDLTDSEADQVTEALSRALGRK
jgi:perosamine synthetase